MAFFLDIFLFAGHFLAKKVWSQGIWVRIIHETATQFSQRGVGKGTILYFGLSV